VALHWGRSRTERDNVVTRSEWRTGEAVSNLIPGDRQHGPYRNLGLGKVWRPTDKNNNGAAIPATDGA
jgi:hypothetical protein